MKKVTIYSSPSCHFCHMVKDFFVSNGVVYEDFDVSTNMEKRKEMVDKSGQMGVPVITVDDKLIIGFDKEKLVDYLELKK